MMSITRLALAALLAGTTSATNAGTPLQTAAAAAESGLTRRDHISIKAIGVGDPVILIPGLSSPRAVWDGVAPAIAKDHCVYLVQVNGFAGGDPRANLESGILEGIVADLHGYIAQHKLEGSAVVGHSMGGLAALMLAKAHPEDAGKLMIVDSLPYIGDIFVPGATVAQIEPQAAAMRDRMKAGYGSEITADSPSIQAVAKVNAL